MHAYASDNFFRDPKIYFLIGMVAVGVASGLDQLANLRPIAGWIDAGALSAATVYVGLILVYDRWLWTSLSTITDLRGTWTGTINSSHNGGTSVPCVLRIRQSWSKISIELESGETLSHSTMAALFQDQPGDRGLKYEYVVEPKNRAADTLQMTRGVCNLSLPDSDNRMTGSYYTGRGRNTVGEISIKRSSRLYMSFEMAHKDQQP